MESWSEQKHLCNWAQIGRIMQLTFERVWTTRDDAFLTNANQPLQYPVTYPITYPVIYPATYLHPHLVLLKAPKFQVRIWHEKQRTPKWRKRRFVVSKRIGRDVHLWISFFQLLVSSLSSLSLSEPWTWWCSSWIYMSKFISVVKVRNCMWWALSGIE